MAPEPEPLVLPNAVHVRGADDPAIARFRWRDRQLDPRIPSPGAPHGLFLAEGDLVVERALEAGHRLEAVLADVSRHPPVLRRIPSDVPLFVADAETRRVMTGLSVALDVIGLFHRRPPLDVGTVLGAASRLVIVQELDNPTNLGALVRSAVALGMDGLLVDRTSADPLARRAVRVSMGTVFSLPHARIGLLPAALGPVRDAGFRLLALTPDPGATALADVRLTGDEAIAVLLGSERHGLSADVLRISEPVRIPMRGGVDSLNVSTAAAVAFYALGLR